MKNYVFMFLAILVSGTVLYLDIRSWHMTKAETFVDITTWIGVFIIVISGGVMIWCSKNTKGGGNDKSK